VLEVSQGQSTSRKRPHMKMPEPPETARSREIERKTTGFEAPAVQLRSVLLSLPAKLQEQI
jgi:hypothetical protein